MLKTEPRTFWIITNMIAFLVGMIWFAIYHDIIGDEVFRAKGYMNNMLYYIGIHTTFLSLHGVYLLATKSND